LSRVGPAGILRRKMRIIGASLLGLLLLLGLGTGCTRSDADAPETAVPALPDNPDTILRLHWQGVRQLSVNGSAYYFMRLWDLPDTKQLRDSTLHKLARLPWRYYGQPDNNAAPDLFFRPVLDNILYRESFLEWRKSHDRPAEFALAVHLNDEEAGSWFTNLAATVQLTTGLAPQSSVQHPRNWTVHSPRSPMLIELKRVEGWTVLGLADTDNLLLSELVHRIETGKRPAPALEGWLTADIDLPRLSQSLGLEGSEFQDLPKADISVNGDGARVLTSARLKFAQPFQAEVEPWSVPSGLIHEPLTSFTAVRDLKAWLPTLPLWKRLQAGDTPDQVFFWSRQGNPLQAYMAVPVSDASNRVQELSTRLMAGGNQWLTNRGYVPFEPWPDGNGVAWGGESAFRPFLRSAQDQGQGYILAGLASEAGVPISSTLRPGLLELLQGSTNLVYYSWEETRERLVPWLVIGQNARALLRCSPFPLDSPAAVWLGGLGMRLDTTETTVTRTGPETLELERKSSIGLTAPELHLLADWLESPTFPFGLHSTRVAPQPPQAAPEQP